MRLSKISVLLFFLTLLVPYFTSAQSSTRIDEIPIVPLKSSRSDAKKLGVLLLENPLFTDYEVKQGKLRIRFSKEPCIWNGWNVAPDLVIEYTLYPKQIFLKKELDNLISGLPRIVDDTFNEYFADSNNGLQYVFDRAGTLTHIRRTPGTTDNALRCKGFAPYSVAADTYFVFESFKLDNPNQWDIGRLGGFLIELKKNTGTKGTIFLYAAQKGEPSTRNLSKRIEKYALEIQGLPKDRISISFGGFRDNWEIDTVLSLKEYPDPIPRPKYPSKK